MKELINNGLNTDSPEKRASELRRRAFQMIRSFAERKWKETDTSNKKADFIEKITDGLVKIIPEAKEETFRLKALANIADTEVLLNQVTEISIELMTKYASLEELEKRFKDRSEKERGNQVLSRGLHFSISKEKTRINLHIPITFFKDAKDFLGSFVEGLRVLASKIKSDLELKEVREVVGHSSLVNEKHRLLTKLGFEVSKDANGKPAEEAKISREKLLELYGSSSTP